MNQASHNRNIRRLLAALALIPLLFLLFLLRDAIWTPDTGDFFTEADFHTCIGRFVFTAAVLVTGAIVVLHLFPFPEEQAAPLGKSILLAISACSAGMFVQWLLALFSALRGGIGTGGMYPSQGVFWESGGTIDVLLLAVSIGLVSPLAEEALFRGVIYRSLAAVQPRLHAALLSSAVFAYFHSKSLQVLLAFAVGLFAALFYGRTGRLLPGVLLHVGLNIGFVAVIWKGPLGYGAVPLWLVAILAALAVTLTAVLYFMLPARMDAVTAPPEFSTLASDQRNRMRGPCNESGPGSGQSDRR